MRRQTCGYLPSHKVSPPIGWYQIILLGDRGTCVLTTCPELNSTVGRLEFEPATCWSQVQHPNHFATEPHSESNGHNVDFLSLSSGSNTRKIKWNLRYPTYCWWYWKLCGWKMMLSPSLWLKWRLVQVIKPNTRKNASVTFFVLCCDFWIFLNVQVWRGWLFVQGLGHTYRGTEVGLLLACGSSLAGCRCHYQWLIRVPVGIEPRLAGCKSATLTTEPRLILSSAALWWRAKIFLTILVLLLSYLFYGYIFP